jgi:hypothetical protein
MSVLQDSMRERDDWVVRRKSRQRMRMVIEYVLLALTVILVVWNHRRILAGLSDLLRTSPPGQ